MIPLDLTADREGERLDAFLARSVPDLDPLRRPAAAGAGGGHPPGPGRQKK